MLIEEPNTEFYPLIFKLCAYNKLIEFSVPEIDYVCISISPHHQTNFCYEQKKMKIKSALLFTILCLVWGLANTISLKRVLNGKTRSMKSRRPLVMGWDTSILCLQLPTERVKQYSLKIR